MPKVGTRLSPDAAYDAIPHRRTVIDLSGSSLTDDDRRYIELAFACLDQAIALRVTTMQDVVGGNAKIDGYKHEQDRLIAFLERIDPPQPFRDYHKKILEALRHQRAFFMSWDGNPSEIHGSSDVARSSGALKDAFNLIKRSIGSKAPGNDDAIFDYHCALDFI